MGANVSHLLNVPRFKVELEGVGIAIGGREDGVAHTSFEVVWVVNAPNAAAAQEAAIAEAMSEWESGKLRYWHQIPRISAKSAVQVGLIGALFAQLSTYRWY